MCCVLPSLASAAGLICIICIQVGLNYSDKSNLVSIDGEKGPLKIGYDFQHEVCVQGGS